MTVEEALAALEEALAEAQTTQEELDRALAELLKTIKAAQVKNA